MKNKLTSAFLIIFIIFILSPMLLILVNSFKPFPFSIGQYFDLLSSSKGYFILYTRSFMIALLITIGQLIVSVVVGFCLGRFKFRGRLAFIIGYVMVFFLPYSATLLPNYMIIKAMGLLGTQASLVLPAIFSPAGVVIMTIFTAMLPMETFEAALLETKSIFSIIRHVLIPQLRPGIALTVIISFTEAWNMVEAPQALMEDKLKHPLSLLLNDIFRADTSVNFAGSALYIIPAMILLFIFSDILINKNNK